MKFMHMGRIWDARNWSLAVLRFNAFFVLQENGGDEVHIDESNRTKLKSIAF